MYRIFLVLAVCLSILSLHAQAPEGLVSFDELNNEAVLKMVREKIPDETIVTLIETNPTHFDTSAKGREQLLQGGVSKRVMDAILNPSRPKAQVANRTAPTPATAANKPNGLSNATAKPAPTTSTPPTARPETTRPQAISRPPVVVSAPASAPPRASSPPPIASSTPPVASSTQGPKAASPAPREMAGASPSTPRVASSSPAPASSTPPAPRVYYSESEDESAPRAEIFGGVAYSWPESGSKQMGWNGAVSGNFNRWFGVVADLSSRPSFQRNNFLGFDLGQGDVFFLLFGPQFTARTGRIDGFARALVGSQHSGGPTPSLPASWRLAYGFGGGADVILSSRFAVRAIQWDVLQTKQADNESRRENRLAFGAVVRF